jgi:putative metallohydrolase (TIGR04338 family)
MKRDSQKSRVYAAERAAFPDYFNRRSAMAGFHSVTECEIWVNRQLQKPLVRRKLVEIGIRSWPKPVRVTDSGGKGGASASRLLSTIYVSGYYRNPVVLLHELAHLLTPSDPGHGWQYAQAYLTLIRWVMGAHAAKQLTAAFKAKRVRFRPKRELTPEAKRQLAERLAQYRTNRVAVAATPSRAETRAAYLAGEEA